MGGEEETHSCSLAVMSCPDDTQLAEAGIASSVASAVAISFLQRVDKIASPIKSFLQQ